MRLKGQTTKNNSNKLNMNATNFKESIMRATETTRTVTRANVAVTTTLTTEDKINGTIIAAFFASGALVGLWSFASLVGGLVAAGGPLGLARGYVQALTGL